MIKKQAVGRSVSKIKMDNQDNIVCFKDIRIDGTLPVQYLLPAANFSLLDSKERYALLCLDNHDPVSILQSYLPVH